MLFLLGVGVCCRLCGLSGIGAVVGILVGLSLSVMACWRVCMRISWFVFVRCWGLFGEMAVVIQTCVSPFSL